MGKKPTPERLNPKPFALFGESLHKLLVGLPITVLYAPRIERETHRENVCRQFCETPLNRLYTKLPCGVLPVLVVAHLVEGFKFQV